MGYNGFSVTMLRLLPGVLEKVPPLRGCLRRSRRQDVCLFVSWCFEPSQPQRITSGLKENFTLSPSYSLNTKPALDTNDLKHFRLMSNLPFISKFYEKIVLRQLQKHLSDNSPLEMHPSAYRKDHSTETAVLSVLNCLLVKANERLLSQIVLLDLSAAFNTLDHSILLRRLEVTFGVLTLFLSGLHPNSAIVVSLLLLMALCLL